MISRLFFIIIILSSIVMAQASQKQLDAFTSTASYFTSAYPGGSGTISTSINYGVFKEGTNSLKIDYSLNAVSENFVEVYKNYGNTKTLDLSFMPDKLSIWLKGQVGNTDIFKFMLYEDQNMNGNPFDAGDEIYVFTANTILNSDSWTQLDMPYSAFVKFGGGTGTLDLNRIGAWRIVIENGTGSSHSGSVYVDDLQQHTTYVPTISGAPKLSGAFIQLWNNAGCNCGQWSQVEWNDQFQKMKELCMDKFIVQYGVYGDNAWYTPSSLSYVTYKNSTLDRIFKAAEMNGLKVYLGLYFDESWNTFDKSVASNYTNLVQKQKDVINEMYTLFGAKAEFAGWYIPQELNDLEWQSTSKRDLVANYLQDVASYAKSKDVTKKVMIAPFFGPYRPADDLQAWYESVLTIATDIDIVYPQDGVGTTTKDVDVDVPHYFKAIKDACDAKGRTFGATVESFLQTDGFPVNENPFASGPAPIANFKTQLQESGKLASDLITFEWGYLQPGLTSQTQQLYDDYKVYSNCKTTNIIVQKDNNDKLKFYPVPVRSGQMLTVEVESFIGDGEISVIDLMGKEVCNSFFENTASIELNLPKHLPNGVYLVFVKNKNEVYTKKIIVE